MDLKTRLGILLGLALLAVWFCCAIAIVGVVTKVLALFFFGIVHNAILSWVAGLALGIPAGAFVFVVLSNVGRFILECITCVLKYVKKCL